MQAVRLNAVVSDDHHLQIVVPEEIPVGEVEVIVLASSPSDARAEQTLDDLFAELDRMPHKRLTKDEVDRYLADERASWD
jgi:hypothetical protein